MVKICPKCGFKNQDKKFWCEKCNYRFIENFDLTANAKNRQDPEFEKEYDEYKNEELIYTHPKSKKKLLALIIVFIILSVVLIGFVFINKKDIKEIKSKDEELLYGEWEIKKYLSNNEIKPFEGTFTIELNKSGYFTSYDYLTGYKTDRWWTEGNKIFFITKTIDTQGSWNSYRLYTPVGWKYSFTNETNLELKMGLYEYEFKYYLEKTKIE